MKTSHDLIVIGGGSAGYAAARTAQETGADVAIVDQGPLGGLCILRGCMPTKAILRSSEVIALTRRAVEFGLAPAQTKADLAAIIARKDRLVREFAEDRIKALHDPRFTLYEERATFRSSEELQVGRHVMKAKAFIIATGSVPSRIPIPGLEETGYLTSDDLLELKVQPASLLVFGGGPVATELAQFYQRIGTAVTLIQRAQHLHSHLDEDMARPLEARFREEGMAVYTGAQLQRCTKQGPTKTVHFMLEGREKTASGELILQALGRRPNIDGLNLEAAQVKVRNGRPLVNAEMRTSQPHIFAVGDAADVHNVVHEAILQGEIAAYNAVHPLRPPRRLDDRLTCEVVFTDPQVATVGLTEKACQRRDIPYLVASHPFSDHGKALCLGETHGQVKLLCRPKTGELLGAHLVGPEAGELIHELIAVMYYHGTVEDLFRIPHYHPTLAEILTYPAEALAAQLG
ncbi:MAG: FAD-binding protein [Nitrospira sp.]|nr:FAD-binding protein [Nitrospira sp.]